MTRKEQAQKLVDEFQSKESALMCVREMQELIDKIHKPEYTTFIIKPAVWHGSSVVEDAETMDGMEVIDYLEDVKTEIEKI